MSDVTNERAETTKGPCSNQSSQMDALMSEAIKKAVSKVLPSSMERVLQEIGYSSVVLGVLHLLAARSHDNYEDLLRKALTLYSFALDAKEQGNRLAVLNPEDEIVHEINGLGFSTESHQVASR
jgi:hypothetical protein